MKKAAGSKKEEDVRVALEVDVAERDIQMAVLRREIGRQAEELGSLQALRRRVEGDAAKIKESLAKTKDEVCRLQGDLATSQGEAAAMKEKLAASQGEVSALKGVLATSQGEVSALNGKLATFQGEVAGLKEKLAASQGEAAALNDKLAASQGEASALKDKLAAAQGEILVQKNQVGALQREVAERIQTYSDLQSRFAAAQAEGKTTRELLEREHRLVVQLQADCRKAERKIFNHLKLMERRHLGTYVRRMLAFVMPYGLVCWSSRRFLGIEKDKPLFYYPGFGKRVRRLVKFMLPFGMIWTYRRFFKR